MRSFQVHISLNKTLLTCLVCLSKKNTPWPFAGNKFLIIEHKFCKSGSEENRNNGNGECVSFVCQFHTQGVGLWNLQKLLHYWEGIAVNPKSFNMVDCGELFCLSESNVNFSIYSHQRAIPPTRHPLNFGHRQSKIGTSQIQWPSGTFSSENGWKQNGV